MVSSLMDVGLDITVGWGSGNSNGRCLQGSWCARHLIIKLTCANSDGFADEKLMSAVVHLAAARLTRGIDANGQEPTNG